MPISKYKSLDDAHKDLWDFEPDISYYKRVREFFELVYRLNPPKIKKKIFKYRSINDAKEDRDKC